MRVFLSNKRAACNSRASLSLHAARAPPPKDSALEFEIAAKDSALEFKIAASSSSCSQIDNLETQNITSL